MIYNKENEITDKDLTLYRDLYGIMPNVEILQGAGSNRVYARLTDFDCRSVILTKGRDIQENESFVNLARVFRRHGLNVPEIFAVGDSGEVYLQQDLGDESLFSLLSTNQRHELVRKTLESLVAVQTIEESEWRPFITAAPFSERLIYWDLNYFKYSFLKTTATNFDESRLEDDFERLAADLMSVGKEQWGFMYRDCQSRNVMIRDGEPWWIDFQGGRPGPMLYDAVSFLWQARAGFTDEERRHFLLHYANAVSKIKGIAMERILENWGLFALFRTLQVLGAYGFRGLIEKKAHFIESISAGIKNLEDLRVGGILDPYPELKRVSKVLSESKYCRKRESDGGLTVSVFSFSYKKGYPEDLSGNGGGFMFDCRGMHNPGRYDEYKRLTGLDKPVVNFLETRGEVQDFVENAYRTVAPSIERYKERGFSSLQVGFGCTGGRHRSVYCAQAFAKMVGDAFEGISIRLEHREPGMITTIEKK